MNNEVFTSAPHAGPVHLCSQCNPVGLAGLRHPDQALLMGVTVCGVCGLKEVLEAHDTVGGRTATAAADGDAGAVAAIVKTFGEGRYEVFADCGRELVRDQWNYKRDTRLRRAQQGKRHAPMPVVPLTTRSSHHPPDAEVATGRCSSSDGGGAREFGVFVCQPKWHDPRDDGAKTKAPLLKGPAPGQGMVQWKSETRLVDSIMGCKSLPGDNGGQVC